MHRKSSLAFLTLLALAAPSAHAQISHSTWGQGGIRIGDSTTTCDAAAEGAIRYNNTSNVHQFCNGTVWANISTSVSSVWEDASDVIRPTSGTVYYSSADFVFGSPQLNADGIASHNVRMFFDKSQGAFRAGMANDSGAGGGQWNATNLGQYSAAFGAYNKASGQYGMAWGSLTTASGQYGTAWGASTTANASLSTAWGETSLASGSHSTAWGYETVASGSNGSTAWGFRNTASNSWTTAFGTNNTASGNSGTAWGNWNQATGYNSTVWGGYNTVSGDWATAFGYQAIAGSGTAGDGAGDYSVAVGMQSAAQTTDPKVTGDRSIAFFFDGNTADANNGYNFSASDKFAIIGGEFQIDNQSSTANKGCIRYDSATTKIQFSHDCSTYTDMGTGTGATLNGISAATASQAGIANGGYSIVWNWDSLAGGTALKLGSASTAATGNTQKILEVAASGANATSTQTTYGGYFTNAHTGTASINIALRAIASGGTYNYSAKFGAGADVSANNSSWTPSVFISEAGNTGIAVRDSTNDVEAYIYAASTGSYYGTLTNHDVIIQSTDTERIRIKNTGNIGLGGISTPSYLLSLNGNAARTIGMERHTTADTAGNSLTILAGGATSGATNKTGGTLILSGGTATGNVGSNVSLYAARDGASGTGNRTPEENFRVIGATKSVTWGEVVNNTLSNDYSTAWGEYVQATGQYSTAFGFSNVASGQYATAWGTDNVAAGGGATAWGVYSSASGSYSTAFGYDANVSGERAIAIGHEVLVGDGAAFSGAGDRSIAISVGDASTSTFPRVTGVGTLGVFMGDQAGVNVTANGVMVILGGNVGIGTASPQSALHVPDGKYMQVEDNNAGAPPGADCDNNAERGRLSLDTTNNRLYICNGATRGWDYMALTD